ncbi:hypothetical protein JN531_012715 [Flagellatimonas centrodinii]|uniref:hypothetical protein n=1 Tax=Flagellatimonas centrodinii TaxID=2806210 RepID=UPI001FEF9CEE|nr:hypothetical protein [Flagellatimonas centrodinii]ULQ45962.1 hypothetical protein JN531_012715 [Flagellatimonas centrodinii]
MATPTNAELLQTAREQLQLALAGKRFRWAGREHEAQDVGVLTKFIGWAEQQVARDAACTRRRFISVSF